MSLERFGQAFLEDQPFRSDRVSEPRLEHPDVDRIHAQAFRRLTRQARAVCEKEVSCGVTVLGGPGVGKSHLLARLYRWSHEPPGATMVFLHNLLAAPSRLPRYVLSATISALAGDRRGLYKSSGFYHLWEAAIREQAQLDAGETLSSEVIRAACETLGDTPDPLDGTIRRVLLLVGLNMFRANRADTPGPESGQEEVCHARIEAGLDWLAGHPLEDESRDLLGLPPEMRVASGLEDDQDVERVFQVLADICRAGRRPFIVAVDQFDNLSEAQVSTLTRFFHVLVDHVPNLLTILSGVRDNVLSLVETQVIPAANWDRVAEERIDLQLVPPALAVDVIRSRIEAFRSDFVEETEVARGIEEDLLFPLRLSALHHWLGEAVEVRPRALIRWARDTWEAEAEQCETTGVQSWFQAWMTATGPNELSPAKPTAPSRWEALVDRAVEAKRRAHFELRRASPESFPPDASNFEELFTRLLRVAAEHRPFGLRKVTKPPAGASYDLLLIDEEGGRHGIAFVVTRRAYASTAHLRRLHLDEAKPDRLILVSDEVRRPIRRTARAREYLDALSALGARFVHIKLDLDSHAQLDALVSVILQAKSGDIEIESNGAHVRLDEDQVRASYVRSGVLEMDPALGAILTRPARVSSRA